MQAERKHDLRGILKSETKRMMQFFGMGGYRSRGVIAAALALLAVAGCANQSGPVHDPFGAYNAQGGSRRGGDFSGLEAQAAGYLTPTTYKGLQGGFLTAPLELPGGRLAVVARSDGGTMLGVIYRDTLIWSYHYAADEHPMPGLAADSAGVIYSVSSRGLLRAISPDGRSLWEKAMPGDAGIVVPALPLALANGVIVASSAGVIARYDRSGAVIWSIRRGAAVEGAFAADPVLGVAVALTHNDYDRSDTLLLLDPATGAERWARPVPGMRIVREPAIIGGHIVIGTATRRDDDRREPSVMAFTGDGRAAWRVPLLLMARGFAGDGEGNTYISCAGTGVQAVGGSMISVDSAGKKRWSVSLESGIPAPAAVGASWVYFIARRDGRTGLFTYSHDGVIRNFLPIDVLPDVVSQIMISSFGELTLAAQDEPVLLRAAS
ncbi:MAG: Pyrrolo-quinoline quinone [Chlorobi bacterium]|nr:Pyrrolo-quinoline quinone [Chlorobiota bacterium]